MPSAPTLTARLMAYRDSLGNPESRALIADALDEISRGPWRESRLLEALRPFAALYRQITRDHGAEWFADEGQTMRAALAYPVADNAVVWRHFRLAAEAIAQAEAAATHPFIRAGDAAKAIVDGLAQSKEA